MSINFKVIRYKNIMSTGNFFTEIKLDENKTTLIVGENGAGKSTILDALSFALYGKPFRKINIPQLLNSINQKDLVVELEFNTGGADYKVVRGLKPKIFEIYKNGELINQDSKNRDYQQYLEQHILKMNAKSFGQIVVLGSANFTPFMQLPAQSRREVIEDLLDIQIFTTMNSLLKEKVSDNKNAIQENKYQIDLTESKIESAEKHNKSLLSLREEEIEKVKTKIKVLKKETAELEEQNSFLYEEMSDLVESIDDEAKIKKRFDNLRTLETSLTQKLKTLQKEIDFFENHDNCPTCKQGIKHEFKAENVTTKKSKIQEIDDGISKLAEELSSSNKKLSEIDQIKKKMSELKTSIAENNAKINMNNKTITDLQKELDSAKQKASEIDQSDIENLKTVMKNLISDQERLFEEKETLGVVGVMLKDGGIKTRIIKQYVPIMNKLINKYLAAMEFFVHFELDESFNETIKSRFRDDFSYSSFSEGEKLRIDLALIFTWRAISKMRNSVSTNLLIMDEILDRSLDNTGTDEFLKILSEITNDSNAFIISHKGDSLHDKFDHVIRFEKVRNFSKIA